MPPNTGQPPAKPQADENLAMIAVILGATSLLLLFITGIPAIILGIIALRKKVGNKAQAQLGLIFGIVGTLLTIPLSILIFNLLKEPLKQQANVPSQATIAIEQLISDLNTYRSQVGSYPECSPSKDATSCLDWQDFARSLGYDVPYDVVFAGTGTQTFNIEPETLEYANSSMCLLNFPISPEITDDSISDRRKKDHIALVYHYADGKACFDNQD